MGAGIGTIVGSVINVLVEAIRAGKSRQEAEAEIIAAIQRGDIVSDDAYSSLSSFVDEAKDFVKNG